MAATRDGIARMRYSRKKKAVASGRQKTMRVSASLWNTTIALLAIIQLSASFRSIKVLPANKRNHLSTQTRNKSRTKCNLIDNSAISLAAGALAGSIGVGVAYPLDALKTKAQTYASSKDAPSG